jgi:uncharacterized protein (DUF58 family)
MPAPRRPPQPRWPRWPRLGNPIADWLESRLPLADTWTLTQRNVYIVPTKAGALFALTIAVMLVSSINYQLNLGYVLTFLLAGSGLVSMHLTHATLRGLQLHLRPVAPGFAGGATRLEVVLTNPGLVRHGIAVRLRRPPPPAVAPAPDLPRLVWCDVPEQGQETVRLALPLTRRGVHPVPALVVESSFPLGLFRAWTVWRPAQQALAWPAPEVPAPPLPAPAAAGHERRGAPRTTGGEFDGVRAWRRGDALRQVMWKKVARTGELVSRDTSQPASRELMLAWHHAAGNTDVEARLSRLSAWVLMADAAGFAWGLELPGIQLAPSHGDAHRLAALERLATWAPR